MAMTMVTIRLPNSLHLGLKELAYVRRKSMNTTAIEALRAAILANQHAARVFADEEAKNDAVVEPPA